MAKFKLSQAEIKELFSQDPAEKDKGGFQAFFVKLQQSCDPKSGIIELSNTHIRSINKHMDEYKKGGWQRKIKRIFERSFRAVFSDNSPMNIYKIDPNEKHIKTNSYCESQIIVANNIDDVIEVAKVHAGSEGERAWSAKGAKQIGVYTGNEKSSHLILASYVDEI